MGAFIVAFAVVAVLTLSGATLTFDEAVLLALRSNADVTDPIGPIWFEETARDVSALGSVAVIFLSSFACGGYLLLRGERVSALLLMGSVASGLLLNDVLKFFFGRPRPDEALHVARVFTSSFPSGHAVLSMIAYGMMATLLVRTARGREAKAFVIAVAGTVIVLIGASRIYLGLHYPSDVLAGWCEGAAWGLMCLQAANRISRPAWQSRG